jgi:hypothetical protein
LHAFSLFLGMALGPVVYGWMIPAAGAAASFIGGGAVVLIAALLIAANVQEPRKAA